MIDWLEIKQFAIAEHVELEFNNNFTAVTGETGSGKSLIVDAIAILLGHRSDSSYIHHNHDAAEIQAGFALSENHSAMAWLKEHEMHIEGECILRRVLRRNKSSKGYINGHAATATQLKDIGKELVDIHGQNEHHSLLKKSTQLHLIDSVSGTLDAISELGDCYEIVTSVSNQIKQLQDQNHSNQERADLLKFQIEELSELEPQPGEWHKLEAAHKRFSHQTELTSGAKVVAEGIYALENDNISTTLLQYSQQLSQLSKYADELKSISEMLEEARVNLEEAAIQLRPLYQDTEIDPQEMDKVESRISLYYSLARKHRVQPDALFDHLDVMKNELEGLKDPESELKRLQDLHSAELEKYASIAEKVSRARKKSGDKLSVEVTEIMQTLGMKGGKIEINFTKVDEGALTRYGNETVVFLVAANAGHPPQPLNKVASGGELSRISLAIQVTLANKANIPTLIFDEVDVGIGGEIANVVGQKLKQLGKDAQVICVTHLSQVASKGDQHFSVSKQGETETGTETGTTVSKLDPQQRIEEIARMTGGKTITEQSLAHAEEMLKSA